MDILELHTARLIKLDGNGSELELAIGQIKKLIRNSMVKDFIRVHVSYMGFGTFKPEEGLYAFKATLTHGRSSYQMELGNKSVLEIMQIVKDVEQDFIYEG